ncbi:MAG: phage portal protein, partial [Deltaproteobacteria bacterium]|nr:phage portal protein [Deltaproteobacteria bacterium]
MRRHEVMKTNWVDRVVEWISPERALKRKAARAFLSMATRAASTSRLRNDWILPGQGESPTPSQWDLDTYRVRSRLANRDDPIASGATDTMQLNIVGSGLRPQARIRGERLGIPDDRAERLNHQAEAAFREFSRFADSGNRLDFDEIQFLAIRKVVEDGESIIIPTWANEAWRPF